MWRYPGCRSRKCTQLALQVPEFTRGGVGAYDGGFLHVDVRLHASRWARVRGQYVGIQQLIKDPILLAKVQTNSQSG